MENLLARKRKSIDALDARIAPLLSERLRLAASLAGLKKKIGDPRREREVLAGVSALAGRGRVRTAVLSVYRSILRQSRLLQEKK